MKKVYEDRLPELIAKEGFATVKALAAATYMSESTVRRRLTAPETAGPVRRSYGGAQLIGGTRNTPIAFRLQKNHKEKDAIAQKAAARGTYAGNAPLFPLRQRKARQTVHILHSGRKKFG